MEILLKKPMWDSMASGCFDLFCPFLFYRKKKTGRLCSRMPVFMGR